MINKLFSYVSYWNTFLCFTLPIHMQTYVQSSVSIELLIDPIEKQFFEKDISEIFPRTVIKTKSKFQGF